MRLLVLSSLALAACSRPPKAPPPERYEPPAAPEERPFVTVRVHPDPGLSLSAMETGCDFWKPEGANCEFVGPEAPARVRVWPYLGPCLKNDRGTVTLATAYPDGKIIFNVECFRRGADGALDTEELAAVMAHELGHQFGIWTHVHADCGEDDVQTHPSGTRLCGAALMNPIRRRDIRFLTPLDHLAFEMRDRKYSVLTADTPGAEPVCVYETPAP